MQSLPMPTFLMVWKSHLFFWGGGKFGDDVELVQCPFKCTITCIGWLNADIAMVSLIGGPNAENTKQIGVIQPHWYPSLYPYTCRSSPPPHTHTSLQTYPLPYIKQYTNYLRFSSCSNTLLILVTSLCITTKIVSQIYIRPSYIQTSLITHVWKS